MKVRGVSSSVVKRSDNRRGKAAPFGVQIIFGLTVEVRQIETSQNAGSNEDFSEKEILLMDDENWANERKIALEKSRKSFRNNFVLKKIQKIN